MLISMSYVVATAVVLIAALTDLRAARVPNALTYSAIVIGLLIGAWPNVQPTMSSSLTGCALAAVPGVVFFAGGGMGGGDVKLLVALGAMLGFPVILDVLFYSVVCGTGLALAIIVWNGRSLEMAKGIVWLVRALLYPGVKGEMPVNDVRFPFAVAVLLGTLWALYVPAPRVSPELAALFGGS